MKPTLLVLTLASTLPIAFSPGTRAAETGKESPRLIIDPGGHSGTVHELLFTPDGRELISLGDDKAIRFWNVESGELGKTLRLQIGDGPEGTLNAGAISPDGKWLAVGGYSIGSGHSFHIIDVRTSEIAAVFRGHTNAINGLAFSPDSRWLASGSGDKSVRVWDLKKLPDRDRTSAVEYNEPQTLEGHTSLVYPVSFSPDGNRLVSGSDDKTLILWEREAQDVKFRRRAVLKRHTAEVSSVAFSPDGRFIVSGGFDHQLLLWDGRTGTFLRALSGDMGNNVGTVTFSPNSHQVLASSQGGGRGITAIFDLATGKRATEFPKHNNSVTASAWHSTQNLVASAGGHDHDIYLWRPAVGSGAKEEAGAVRHHLLSQGRTAWAAAFAKAGLQIAFGNTNNAKDPTDQTLEQTFDILAFSLAAFEEKKDAGRFRRTLPTSGGNTLKLIDQLTLEVGTAGTIKNNPVTDYWIYAYSFTPDGSGVIVGSSFSLKLYQNSPSGFAPVREFVGHGGAVWAVSPSPDGRYLASASGDQTVRLWNLKTGELLASLFVSREKEWVVWTPSGHYHASPGGEQFIGWHINKGIDKVAEFYPSYVFRDQFHHPELVRRTIALGSYEKALAEVGTKVEAVESVLPPKVDWVLPARTRGENRGAEVTVRAEIDSPNAELEEVKLLLNGKAVASDFRVTGNRMTFERTVPLLPGENRLAIFARNRHSGHTSTERILVHRPAGIPAATPDPGATESLPAELKPNLYVLSVGISDYTDPEISLEFCDDDAEAVAAVFAAQKGKLFRNVEVKLLTNEKATRLEILNGLSWLEQNATQKDMVVLFLAAHGANDTRGNYYLLPTAGEFKNLRGTGVAWDDFAEVLGNLPSRTLMFLDTCHSGQLGKNLFTFATRGEKDAVDDASEAIRELTSEENGVVIMSAATGAEDSVEHEKWGHGAFTMALLDGITRKNADLNSDGIIHLRELDFYVADRVKELTGGIQHPTTVKPSTISRLPLALLK